MIVVLVLAAAASGTVGVLSGSGCTRWSQRLWSSGEFWTTGSRSTTLFWGTSRTVMVHHMEFLDAHAVPGEKRYPGPGWLYTKSVVLNEPSGLYVRSSMLIVSFIIPLLMALLFSSYPAVLLIRVLLRRRHRQLQAGLCLHCEYDLTGNESGVCPECGTEVHKT